MKEKLEAAKAVLKKYGQEQLLSNYEKLSEESKSKLLDEILTVDFNQISELYNSRGAKQVYSDSEIEPIAYVEKEKMSKEEKEKYDQIGIEKIKEGKLAVVTMAGGQGTRLGHNGPKGTFDIGLESHKSIFEILCDTLKAANQKYEVTIPWYIMTSKENNSATVNFFEEHKYFGYPKGYIQFFKQGELPMVGEDGKVLLDEEGMIKFASDGHGGVFSSMLRDGVIYDMKARKIKWVFIGAVDNVLVKMVDPTLIGLAEDRGVLVAGKSVVKAGPHEKVGVFCKKGGKPGVIEYSEISKEMVEERDANGELKYGESQLNCNLFALEALEKVSEEKLPYHSAHKKATYMDVNGEIIKGKEPNAYKFETFFFDAFGSLDDMAIMRVKREEEFAPVKNADGDDSPETARKLYQEFWKTKLVVCTTSPPISSNALAPR